MSMTQEAGRVVASLKSSASSQGSEIHRALLLKAANQIESDQAKLAEREAELAQADAVIERRECQWLALADGHSPTFSDDDEIDQYETESLKRHAARQQPTKEKL